MRTATGIKGIRKFLKEGANKQGWQTFVDNEYVGFSSFDAHKIYAVLCKATAKDLMLSDVIGNGLWFSSR